jgi:parvulin-like peptidyl-prolyl isomerase
MQTKILIVAVLAIIATAGALMYFTQKNDSPSLLSGEQTGETTNDVVAVVNGENISRGELETARTQVTAQQGIDMSVFDDAAKTQFDAQILESLISQRLIQQASAKANITIDDATVDTQMATIRSQFATEEEFAQALTAEGLSEEALKAQIKKDLTTQTYLEQELQLSAITVTEEEVNTTYTQVAVGEEVPPLEEVYAQVENMVREQKTQERIATLLERLSAEAQIERML